MKVCSSPACHASSACSASLSRAGWRSLNSAFPALPFCHLKLTASRPLPAAYPRELKALGDHIRKRRLDFGLLQREVAQALGVTEATIKKWENSRSYPALRFVPRIVEFLGYDLCLPDDDASSFQPLHPKSDADWSWLKVTPISEGSIGPNTAWT